MDTTWSYSDLFLSCANDVYLECTIILPTQNLAIGVINTKLLEGTTARCICCRKIENMRSCKSWGSIKTVLPSTWSPMLVACESIDASIRSTTRKSPWSFQYFHVSMGWVLWVPTIELSWNIPWIIAVQYMVTGVRKWLCTSNFKKRIYAWRSTYMKIILCTYHNYPWLECFIK